LDLKKRTVKGISWTSASQFSRLLITLTVTVILAHLLEPEDFGLIAMAAAFSNFFAMFNDLGLSSAIIHKRNVTEEDLSSAFWFNLLEGVVVSIVFLAFAPVIAGFYGESELKPIIMALSAIFTITSVAVIQVALLSKRMDFKTMSIIEIVASVLGGVVAVSLASMGFGVWSIVFQSLTQALTLSGLMFVFSDWRPRWLYRWQPLKGLLRYSLPLMGFNFVNYFSRNLDNLLIGRYLGASQLGYYDVAYRSLLFPLSNVSTVIGRVMFPALSHLEEDKARVRAAYISATRYIAVVTFPLMAGLAVLAPQLVRVLLGAKWDRAILIIQLLTLVGALQSVITTVGWIYLSQGRTGVMFAWGSVSTVIYAGCFIAGLHWEVEGVAVAYAIAVVLLTYPAFAIPFRFIDMGFWHYAKQFWTIATATLGMSAVMIGLRFLFEKVLGIGDLPILAILIIIGVACYAGVLLLVDRKLLGGLLGLLRDLKTNKPSPEE
jgi:O-antigen/teichoic acid export membrane protein